MIDNPLSRRLKKGAAEDGAAAERFQLAKWYADCVSDRGEALIACWAKLRWRRLSARYGV